MDRCPYYRGVRKERFHRTVISNYIYKCADSVKIYLIFSRPQRCFHWNFVVVPSSLSHPPPPHCFPVPLVVLENHFQKAHQEGIQYFPTIDQGAFAGS